MTSSGPTFEPSPGDDADELLPQPPTGRLHRSWLALAAVAVLAAVVAFAATRQHHRAHPQTQPDSTPSELRLPPTPDTTDPVVSAPALPDVGRFQLFARAANAVVEINFTDRWVMTTPIPALSTNVVGFVATPSGVLIRPSDADGYYVPDGATAQRATGAMAAYGALPGPAPGEFWVPRYHETKVTALQLLATGASTRQTLRIPADVGQLWGNPVPDGSGYVLLNTSRGLVDLRPDGAHVLSRTLQNTVVATGADRLLVASCPQPSARRCAVTLGRLPDGDPTTSFGRLVISTSVSGVISPDTGTAIVYQPTVPGQLAARLLDLGTGRFRGAPVAVDPDTEQSAAAFSPDGRWAFLVGAGGTLVALDARTGAPLDLDLQLPHLYQLAVRG